MKLGNLKSKSKTSHELLHPSDNSKSGVVFSGHTPDSPEWKKAVKDLSKMKATKKQSYFVERKSGDTRIDIDREEALLEEERQVRLVARMTTKVSGIDDLKTPSEDDLVNLFSDPEYQWIYQQWYDWLNDRGNWFKTFTPSS